MEPIISSINSIGEDINGSTSTPKGPQGITQLLLEIGETIQTLEKSLNQLDCKISAVDFLLESYSDQFQQFTSIIFPSASDLISKVSSKLQKIIGIKDESEEVEIKEELIVKFPSDDESSDLFSQNLDDHNSLIQNEQSESDDGNDFDLGDPLELRFEFQHNSKAPSGLCLSDDAVTGGDDSKTLKSRKTAKRKGKRRLQVLPKRRQKHSISTAIKLDNNSNLNDAVASEFPNKRLKLQLERLTDEQIQNYKLVEIKIKDDGSTARRRSLRNIQALEKVSYDYDEPSDEEIAKVIQKKIEKVPSKSVSKKKYKWKPKKNLHLQCPHCPHICARRYHLKRHMIRHTREPKEPKPYPCTHPNCGRSYKNPMLLAHHKKCHLPSEILGYKRIIGTTNSFCCLEQNCSETFRNITLLENHCISTHAEVILESELQASLSENNNYKCCICLKLYTNKWYLNLHLKAHPKQDSYECKVCKRLKPTSLEKLKQHFVIHRNEFKYNCDLCPQKFHWKVNWQNHLKYRHPSDPDNIETFLCNYCGKLFKRPENLRLHINSVHLKLRPFKCKKCSMSFKLSSHFVRHVKLIHNNPNPKHRGINRNKDDLDLEPKPKSSKDIPKRRQYIRKSKVVKAQEDEHNETEASSEVPGNDDSL